MKFKRVALPFLVVLLAFFLSACGTAVTTQGFPGLTLQDETIYLSEGLHVYAVNVASGKEVLLGDVPLRFPAEAEGNINLFAPVTLVGDGQIVFPNSHPSEHSLYSIDPQSGSTRWVFQKSKGTWIAGALALNNGIYAPGGDGALYALDATGNMRWMVQLSKNGLWTQPVSDGKYIFQATMDGELFALSPSNGNQLWKVELDTPILGAPVVDEDGNLYVGTLSGILYSLQGANGKINWQQQLDGRIWSTPTLNADKIYIGTLINKEGKFYALQKENGAILWQRPESGSIIASPLAFGDQVIYVTETGRVQALTSDGSPKWQADLKGKLLSAPILAGELVIIAPLQGDYMLVAFDMNGAQKWTFKAEK